MKFYSTKRQSPEVDLQRAVVQGLPKDNGLFMPQKINALPSSFFENIEQLSFPEMAYQFAHCLLQDAIPANDLKDIIYDAINFGAPLVSLNDHIACLELFHGPSLAFKDFGARFMARIMSYFVQEKKQKEDLYILVATSGDTGGAVAQGFLQALGIKVIILYPSKKISALQEKQLTTLGHNITALEVEGVFDDCQRLVKRAFLDEELTAKMNLSSANSINIARLIPQAFYYLWAYAQQKDKSKKTVFCVPSGNFGNLTAGLLAKKMGLPVHRFVAANNANDVVKEYLDTGVFTARPSVKTYANAMDVGNPSNLQRIQDLYNNDIDSMRRDIVGYRYDDAETVAGIQEIHQKYDYVVCPHSAVGYLAIRDYLQEHGDADTQGIFLATAHPAKFLDIVEPALNLKVEIPSNLAILMERKKEAKLISKDYADLKAHLMGL